MDSQKQKETAENKKAVEKKQAKPRAKKAAEKTGCHRHSVLRNS